MKRIVITGARGYIGTALTERLAADGYSLRLVSRSELTRRSAQLGARIECVAADLRDARVWSRLLDGVDMVIHLSSRTDLRGAEQDPLGDDDLNVGPVRALISAATNSPRVLFASTVTIAGVDPRLPVDEECPDEPCSVYDRHKLVSERLLREATQRGVLRAASLRLSNVYGHGGASINANRGILNAMLKNAIASEPLTLFGDGAYTRDYTHLADVVDAFHRAIAEPRICDGRHYVVATGKGNTLAQTYKLVVEAALRHTGRQVEIRHVPEPRDLQPIERRNFIGNSRLFQCLTGWRPQFDLKAGIDDYFDRAMARAPVPVAK